MKSGIDSRQFEMFRKGMLLIDKDFDRFLENFMLEIGLRVLRRTKQRTPIDTGALRAAWKLSDPRTKVGSVEIDIMNGQDYATFLEYGTCRGIKPYYMVTVPIDEIIQEMPTRFHKKFKAYVKQRGAL